jgi:glycosyltransferase involved in cell wall biosynthesis
VILFLHNRYRATGGEEQAVANFLWLVREKLGEDAELLERDSATLGRSRAAAAMLRGGLDPGDVAHAVKRTGARVVHAHNLNPAFGWQALAAAREAGAGVVLHLHQARLVCAVGICFTAGRECTRCHGRNTLPGVVHRCRGNTGESLVYAAALALWQRRMIAQADSFIVPSQFAADRLGGLGVRLTSPHVLPAPIRSFALSSSAPGGRYALYVGRLEPEKGVAVAVEACAAAGIPLVLAGEGPERARLEGAPGVTFAGQLDAAALAELRAGASVALLPSLCAEMFPLAAAEAMAAGLPLAASAIGGLPEFVPADWLVTPGDAGELAQTAKRLIDDASAGERALAGIRERLDPGKLAATLAGIYS